MSEYHVSCGMFGIYAGTVKKNGTEWKDKTRVTEIELLVDTHGQQRDGKTVTLRVSIEDKEQTE